MFSEYFHRVQKENIIYKNSKISYQVFGNGSKLLFCFHGYGETAKSFIFLEPLLGKDFTMVALNLPYHGETEWNEGLLFTSSDLMNIISLICTDAQSQIYLLGYSMGGRLALQLLQDIPKKIESVVLVAPDGLHKNFWYSFATQTLLGNKLFALTMKHPGWLFALVNVAAKLKMLNSAVIKIAHYYLDDANERTLLYKRWTTMRKFNPNLYLVKFVIKENKMPVRFLFGKFDRIILSKRSNFFKGDMANIQVHVIEAGHQLMKEKYAAQIAALFYQ